MCKIMSLKIPKSGLNLHHHKCPVYNRVLSVSIDKPPAMPLPSLLGSELAYLPKFATSLAIGLLIGLERERSPSARAGLRTFALVTMFGTLSGLIASLTDSTWLILAGVLAIAAFMVSAYRQADLSHEPGTTTQAAILLTYMFGVGIWFGLSKLIVILAIVSTALLYFKPELRVWSERLTRRDLLSILQFAILSFVILPILPDQDYGPHQAINPYQVWWMVVLISGMSLAGYIALQFVNEKHGAPLLGFLGGMVSSTATSLVYARHSRANTAMSDMATIVILIANLVVLLRLFLLGMVVSPRLIEPLSVVFGSGVMVGIAFPLYWWRRLERAGNMPLPEMKNPTEIRTALTFGAIYAGVLFLTAWLSDVAGSRGLYLVALVSGITDMDAIMLSSLRLFNLERISAEQAMITIVLGLLSNTAFKLTLVVSIAGKVVGGRCASGMIAIGAGLTGALLLI